MDGSVLLLSKDLPFLESCSRCAKSPGRYGDIDSRIENALTAGDSKYGRESHV